MLALEILHTDLTEGDFVRQQPDIQQTLRHEAEDARVIGRVIRDVETALQFEQDVEEPRAIGIRPIAPHDEHVEAVPPGPTHAKVIGGKIALMAFGEDLPRRVQVHRMVSMDVLRIIGLDEVVSWLRQQDVRRAKELTHPGGGGLEMATVMDESEIVRLEVLPRPVESGQLAVVGVLRADVVPGVVTDVAEIRLARGTDLQGQELRRRGHRIGFVRRDQESEIGRGGIRHRTSHGSMPARPG